MIENTNTKQFYPGPILNNTLEITDFLFNDAEQIKIKYSKLNEEGVLIDIDLDYPIDYEVTKILPSDIDATEAALTASTGQVLLKNVNVLAGEKLTVYRVSQIIQDMDYPRTGAFPAASHEGALDYLTMQNQEQQEQINRALKIPNSVETFDAQMPTPLPARTLKINADGTGFELSKFDPDVAVLTTEEYKNQAQQAAIEALASQNIATEQANIATEQATIATNKASEVVASGNTALNNIDTAKDNAITSITNQETTSKNNIINEGATQVANVNSAGATQVNLAKEQVTLATNQANIATQQATIATNKTSEVVTSGNEALSSIDTAKTGAITDITNLKNTSVSNITTAKDNAITSITNQEITSKNNIINEGATQVGLVRQEGIARVEDILETGCIDVDYTEETSTLIFTGGGNALLSNYYTKEETDNLIPTNNNQLVNGAGYITAEYHDSTKQDVITDLDTIRSGASKGATALQSYTETDPVYIADKPNIALKSEIPTKVSSFTNDANYQTYTDVASMIASIPQFELKIVDELPTEGQKMVLYLVPKISAGGDDIYDEYIWLESTSSFELVGSTTLDLSDYYSKTETNELLNAKQDTISDLDKYAKTNVTNNFTMPQVITTNENKGLEIYSSTAGGYLYVTRGGSTPVQMAIKSGANGGTFGTTTPHQFQFRTNDIARMVIGADGSVTLAQDVSSSSNDNQVATTKWVNNKLSNTETWTFTLEDGTEVVKTMVLGA